MRLKCEYCQELIQEGAVICPYCQQKSPLKYLRDIAYKDSLLAAQRYERNLKKSWERSTDKGISFEEYKRKHELRMEERDKTKKHLKYLKLNAYWDYERGFMVKLLGALSFEDWLQWKYPEDYVKWRTILSDIEIRNI